MPTGKQPPHSSDLRKGRQSIPGWAYFITKCVLVPATDFLTRPECARLAIESFRWASQQNWWVNLGFVIMPDHYHLILGLGKIKTLSEAVKSINKYTARRINVLIGSEGHFWEEGFHDHAIRSHKDFDTILEYVHNNPVRAGLVERAELWPYSTANEMYTGDIDWDWVNGVAEYPGEDWPAFNEDEVPR